MYWPYNGLTLLALLLATVNANLWAEIITDGTVGPIANLQGPDFIISQDIGTQSGNNLFHSFNSFSIYSGESATFTGNGDIQNVISRVTGGKSSNIDGLLRSEVGQADFYFINPTGIVFGPNAQVDVPAAFHISTADELRFEDGTHFSASDSDSSTLGMAAPEAFGFLSSQPATLSVNDSQLEFRPDSTISLSAGHINLTGDTDNRAQLSSPGGEIHIYAVGDKNATILVNEDSYLKLNGTINSHSSLISSTGSGSGSINIQAGNMTFQDTMISNGNNADSDAIGEITIQAGKDLSLIKGTQIHSHAQAGGDSGNINIKADNLTINQYGANKPTGIISDVEADASGDAGDIHIALRDKLDILGVGIISSASYGDGNAGDITLTSASLTIDGDNSIVPYRNGEVIAGISSETLRDAKGDAGDVSININGWMELYNGSSISTYSDSTGNAGNILIQSENLLIDKAESDYFTGIVSSTANKYSGNAGDIEIHVSESLQLLNGGEISSNTDSLGDAGSIFITTKQLFIQGYDSDLSSSITSQARENSQGNAGNIHLDINDSLQLLPYSYISSTTFSNGAAGSIFIDTGEIQILGNKSRSSFIQTSTFGTGNAGNIHINVDKILQLNSGIIESSTVIAGNGGIIYIHAENLIINGSDSNGTGISSSTHGVGHAGAINININDLLYLTSGAQITSHSSFSIANAGEINIQAGQLLMEDKNETGTRINSSAVFSETGKAGDIDIEVDNLLQMLNSSEILSTTSGEGDAGTITIKANQLKMNGYDDALGARISTEATSTAKGNAGNININVTDFIHLINESVISSGTWGEGEAGVISINSNKLIMSSDLTDNGFYIFTPQISTNSLLDSLGNAGGIDVKVNELIELSHNAEISSYTTTSGNAGKINLEVNGLLNLTKGGNINTTTKFSDTKGNAGQIKIRAKNIKIGSPNLSEHEFFENTGIISSVGARTLGHAGDIDIEVSELLEIKKEGIISSSSESIGNAGSIVIKSNALLIDAQNSYPRAGIITNADRGGNAGDIEINIDGPVQLINAGEITSNTESTGDGGNITLLTGDLIVDDAIIQTETSAEGNAGKINILANGKVQMFAGASISSSANYIASGDAGSVSIKAGDMHINGENANFYTGIKSSAKNSGNISNTEGSHSQAGAITVEVAGLLELLSSATISSETNTKGDAGSITIKASQLILDHQKSSQIWEASINTDAIYIGEGNSQAKAGNINIIVDDLIILKGRSLISSRSNTGGNAGEIVIQADKIILDAFDTLRPRISTEALTDSQGGHAGTIRIKTDKSLQILNGSKITSSSLSTGNAGSISINSDELIIDGQGSNRATGISSSTGTTASGLTGNIEIASKQIQILNQGFISIENRGNVSEQNLNYFNPSILSIRADSLLLKEHASINASSRQNPPASNIVLELQKQLILSDNSKITTEANSHNGGDIDIQTGNYVSLQDSQISTSTIGGDGGDITVSSETLLMNGGFIQANTGQGAFGGNIVINADSLMTPYSIAPEIGGLERFEFITGSNLNIIQAAAPSGNPGNLTIDVPDIDIASSLAGLTTDIRPETALEKNPCSGTDTTQLSSLSVIGKGSIPSRSGISTMIPISGRRLDKLLSKPLSKNRFPESDKLYAINKPSGVCNGM